MKIFNFTFQKTKLFSKPFWTPWCFININCLLLSICCLVGILKLSKNKVYNMVFPIFDDPRWVEHFKVTKEFAFQLTMRLKHVHFTSLLMEQNILNAMNYLPSTNPLFIWFFKSFFVQWIYDVQKPNEVARKRRVGRNDGQFQNL